MSFKSKSEIEERTADIIAETDFHWTIENNEHIVTISKSEPFGWSLTKEEAVKFLLESYNKYVRKSKKYTQECEEKIKIIRESCC